MPKETIPYIERVNMKLFLALLIISLSGFPTLGSIKAASDNLIENGGFEEEGGDGLPRGWQIIPNRVGRGEAIMDYKSVHSGKSSLRLKPNKRTTSEGFGIFMMLDRAKVQGKEITISGYAKLEDMRKITGAILFKTDRENWVIIPKVAENKFVPFSKTFSVATSIPEAALLLLVGGTKGSVWLDNLSLRVSFGTTSMRDTLRPSTDEYVNKINTPGWQDSAFISPDGQELYFAYMPYAQKEFMDILFGRISEKDVKLRGPIRPGSHGTMNFETYKASRRKDGTWSKPINLNINSTYSLYSAKLSYDGKELYFAIRDYHKNYGADDIYVSKKLPDGSWGPPQNLGPNINTRFRDDTPCLSADGRTLYFGRNRGETLGWEIMASMRLNGQWTKAKKLGSPVNQPKPETTANYQPFITADGKELYFTRITNLYKSERQPNGAWGKPVKVFPHLAVSGHASVTADGRYLYLLTAEDEESLKRHHWTIWYSERQVDGSWGKPRPVD
ncbi:MAG: hypothetical protein GTO24_15715 [candidate division Zixibacteria bacterium]|nr:hypothetical protein [candidate division Zixibacteria bacterium]